CQRYSYAPLTF
nr:immunoglobulin light chain junction region [Macaca mulatta]MOW62419.1 immunoglobulin light chain junction region [Macaca mulatta]MOW62572.1 immunoglobulin light chain junction region [Macaca mulatta]MOW62707.1 immunoglobulin light chain junction region [Macaca mulatta]MOW63976.1 immunoglobulin light chain junction region [Macaca mulatta]